MLVNRLLEAVRSRGQVHRELARRSRDAKRAPVIFVPSALGVRLVDRQKRTVWGTLPRLFVGDTFADIADLEADGWMTGLPMVPGIVERDVFGGVVHYLERIYGARLGEELFVLDYDWRAPLATAAGELAKLVARVRGASDTQVDLVGVCSGGAVIRTFLAGAWEDDPADALADPVLGPGPAAVRRAVYLGAPHRGFLGAFTYVQDGLLPMDRAQWVRAEALQQRVPLVWDLLPHHRVFVDGNDAPLDLDHFEVSTWKDLGLVGAHRPGLADDLSRARRLHAILARAEHGDATSIVIADRHRATPAKVVVEHGRATFPCRCGGDRQRLPFAFEDGDGVVPATSLAAAPGLPPDGPWWVATTAHARVATDAHVWPLIVEALLSPAKRVPRERYLWPRNPETRGVVPPEDDTVTT